MGSALIAWPVSSAPRCEYRAHERLGHWIRTAGKTPSSTSSFLLRAMVRDTGCVQSSDNGPEGMAIREEQ